MNISKYYKEKLEKSNIEVDILKNIDRIISIIKISIVIFTLIILTMFFNGYFAFAAFVLFLIVLKYDINNLKKLNVSKVKSKIYEDELNCLNGKNIFNNGSEFIDKNHNNSYDLDVFGEKSLFHLINRTTTRIGKLILADWFKNPTLDNELIKEKQLIIKELSGKVEWREKLQIEYNLLKKKKKSKWYSSWINDENIFIHRKNFRILIIFLPILTITLGALYAFGLISYLFVLVSFLVQFDIARRNAKQVAFFHNKISYVIEEFNNCAKILFLIEQEDFESPILNSFKKDLKIENVSAHKVIIEMTESLKKLDYRLNFLMIPFVILFFYDIHQIISFEKLKTKYSKNISRWFDIMGEIDAYSSVANFSFNKPDYIFPQISSSEFELMATELGHPLITNNKCVCNDVEISGKANILFVTGSNMSGKSTFQRTLGLNILLTNIGAPVFAKKLIITPINIISSMRISDALNENVSSFYAELIRLKKVLKAAKKGEHVFLILDEILRGTNSRDRHLGSKALIKQLIKYNSVGVIATHDIELSELTKEYPNNIKNYNFNVNVDKNNKLFFDYKLNPGVCRNFNASILMKEIGIEISDDELNTSVC